MVMLPNKLHYFVLQIELRKLRIPLAPISNNINKKRKKAIIMLRNLIEIQYFLLDMLLSS